MSAGEVRVYTNGLGLTHVIGTRDMQEACRVLGISPETHKWGSTDSGMYCKRSRGWREVGFNGHVPLDAKPGVVFHGFIRPKGGAMSEVDGQGGSGEPEHEFECLRRLIRSDMPHGCCCEPIRLERERCAKVVDEIRSTWFGSTIRTTLLTLVAAAIREGK